MEVAFVNNTSESFTPTQSGAIATHIWECCRAASERNDKPVVFSRKAPVPAYEGIRSVLVEPPSNPRFLLFERLLRLERRLTGWRHLGQRALSKRLARAIRDSKMESGILILHNDPEMAVLLRGRFPDAFIVHHFHNLLECKQRFRWRLARSVNAITAVSDFTGRWVEKYYRCGSVTTVYNGVDLERFRPPASTRPGVPLINFTGRTGIEKAPDLLLRAACELSRRTVAFSVQILGSNHWQKFEWDDYQANLKELADRLQAAGVSVERPGHIDRHSLPEMLQRANIHVVPSRWDEPFGLVTLEGMATGLATVASRTGGTSEIVGSAGLMFERDNVNGLAEHLYRLVVDEGLRISYGKQARERARMFTWEKTWESFRSVVR